MAIKVYNTMTRRKEEFSPREPGRVSIYVCGITPYSRSHIGHARPSIVWDAIRRYLEYRGYQVFMVQNFTDIDDKIIAASVRENMNFRELAEKYSEDYLNSMDALGVKRANIYPRATDHIEDIIRIVKTLVDKGYAYVAGGDVYFDVSRFPSYGKLSGRSTGELMAGARVEVGEKKDDPLDFALWKAAKEGEPSWESPWGPGRPGWHIECSAMSLKYLGNGFDFHGGGTELIFPHHENEIAQSEAYTGSEPFVRYWVHNELLNLRGEKMSKSLGNIVSIQDVLSRYRPEVVRLAMLSAHYRTPLEFSDESLEAAKKGWEKLDDAIENARAFLRKYGAAKTELPADLAERLDSARTRFEEAMDDDFNTALAIGVLFDLARDLNCAVSGGAIGERSLGGEERAAFARRALDVLLELGGVLGVVRWAADECDGNRGREALLEAVIGILLDVREEARKKKDYATADRIRARLGEIGIVVEDSPQGVRWKRAR